MLLRKEFKDNFKSLLIWSGIISSIFLLILIIYPVIISSSTDINEALEGFSLETLAVFNLDIIDLSKYSGWYISEGLIFVILGIGIYSAILGSSIVLKEENDKTIEYLATLPISRSKILLNKVVVAIMNIIIITLIVSLVNVIGALLIEDTDALKILMISFMTVLSSLVIFFVNLLMSMFFKKTSTTLTISVGITFVFYFFDVLTKLSDKLDIFKYITPVTLADTRNLILNNGFNWGYILITVIVCTILLIFSLKQYNKKEFA